MTRVTESLAAHTGTLSHTLAHAHVNETLTPIKYHCDKIIGAIMLDKHLIVSGSAAENPLKPLHKLL